MIEQLPHGDVVAMGNHTGQLRLDVVIDAYLALGHKLKYDGGHETLRHTPGPKPVPGVGSTPTAQICCPTAATPHPTPVPHLGHGSGHSGADGGVEGLLERGPIGTDAGCAVAMAGVPARASRAAVATSTEAAMTLRCDTGRRPHLYLERLELASA
nr:hypothetical protein [Streptomyces sp. NRRL S-1813]